MVRGKSSRNTMSIFNLLVARSASCVGSACKPLPMMLCWQGSSPCVGFIYMIFLWKHHLWLPSGLKQDKTSINQVKKKKLPLQAMYPKTLRPQWVSLSSGCQRVQRSLLCLCLNWQQLPSIICCEENMGTMTSYLPYLLNQFAGMRMESY